MLSRTARRAALDSQWQAFVLPPTFLLPLRAKISTTPNFIESASSPQPFQPTKHVHKPTRTPVSPSQLSSSIRQEPDGVIDFSSESQSELPLSQPAAFPPTIRDLLPLLRAQPSHYITAHIHARPYLLTQGDTLRLPFHMPKVKPGDVLRLNRASSIGSRDYTMRGAPYIDERLFECRAIVVGVEAEPMRFIEKTARRNRRLQTIKSKHRFTVLKVRDLKIRSLAEVEEESVVGDV